MVDNQHQQIAGYRDLNDTEILVVNTLKQVEENLLEVINTIDTTGVEPDPRWLATARTHFETGFMYAIKAITKPDTPYNRSNNDKG